MLVFCLFTVLPLVKKASWVFLAVSGKCCSHWCLCCQVSLLPASFLWMLVSCLFWKSCLGNFINSGTLPSYLWVSFWKTVFGQAPEIGIYFSGYTHFAHRSFQPINSVTLNHHLFWPQCVPSTLIRVLIHFTLIDDAKVMVCILIYTKSLRFLNLNIKCFILL